MAIANGGATRLGFVAADGHLLKEAHVLLDLWWVSRSRVKHFSDAFFVLRQLHHDVELRKAGLLGGHIF